MNSRYSLAPRMRFSVPPSFRYESATPSFASARSGLPVRPIRADDGWCEDPRNRRYNQPVRLPPGHPGDRLWRTDALYDFLVELDHNTRPRIAGRGSAVFVHVARPGFAPTAGCVALPAPALRQLIQRAGPHTRIVIG